LRLSKVVEEEAVVEVRCCLLGSDGGAAVDEETFLLLLLLLLLRREWLRLLRRLLCRFSPLGVRELCRFSPLGVRELLRRRCCDESTAAVSGLRLPPLLLVEGVETDFLAAVSAWVNKVLLVLSV